MRSILLSLSLFLCLGALLHGQLNAPNVGVVLYPDGNVHAVRGLSADLIVQKQPVASAVAISFSDAGGLIASKDRISLVRADFSTVATYPSIERAPLVNIDGGLDSAIAWLPSSSSLLYSAGASLTTVEVHDAAFLAHVTSIHRESQKTASVLVSDPSGTVSKAVVSLETGEILSTALLPGVQAPAFFENSFVLFTDENGLEVLSPNGGLRPVPLAAANLKRDLKIERMSSGWLHLSAASSKQSWVLHLTDSALHLSELPGRPSPASNLSGITVTEASK